MVQIVAHDCPRCGSPTQGKRCAWCARIERQLKSVEDDVKEAEAAGRMFAAEVLDEAKERKCL